MGFQEQLREEITNKIVQSLEKGVSPWRQPWVSGLPTNLISKKPYRGINTLLLALHQSDFKFTSNVYATFNQWKDKGCMVKKRPANLKKDEDWGCGIVFFAPVKKIVIDKKTDMEKVVSFPIMRTYRVFNANQVEGADKIVEKYNKPITDPAHIHDEAERVVKASGATIETGLKACYKPFEDIIEIPLRETFTNGTNSYYGTLFHELIHYTGHQSRLNRLEKFSKFGSNAYALEELVAEIGGCFMLGAVNLPVLDKIENHVSYLNSWLRVLKEDHKAIFQASAAASAAADFILKKAGIEEDTKDEELLV